MKNKFSRIDGDAWFCNECKFMPISNDFQGKEYNHKGNIKRGWNGGFFCCKACEVSALRRLFASMPGHGGNGDLSDDVRRQVNARWDNE